MKSALFALLFAAIAPLAAQDAPAVRPLSAGQLAFKSVKIAAVQIDGPWAWQVPSGPDNDPAAAIIPYIERAGRDGADLVVFPELFLGMFRVPSPQTKAISAAAKRNKVNVMVGCFEVINPQGDYGNSTLVFNREGEIVGRYFKAYQAVGEMPHCWPPKADDPEWLMKPGEETPVFDLDFGRVGILTCYDGYFPELFRLLSLKGAEIIVWPNARGGSVEDYIVKTNLHQNYVHIVTTNKALGAGTMIAAWPNRIVQQLSEPGEGYIIAELGLTDLRQARIHSREFRQRRPAMYRELAKDWPVAAYYGVDPAALEVPSPSPEAKAKVLERSGVSTEP
jgi:beta-ureidopropionase